MPHHTARTTQPPEAPETSGRTIRLWARFYDLGSWLMSFGQGAKMNRDIVEMAGIRPGQKVLDVGCGTGAQTLLAAEAAGPGHAAGIDASPEMIEVARRKAMKKGLEIDLRVAAIEALPFGDSEFDAVLSGFMLHHLPDDLKRKGFAEVRRVLKPGGRFLAVDMVGGGTFAGRIIKLLGHVHSGEDVERMKEMLGDTGFEVEELKTRYKGLVFLLGKAGTAGGQG